MRNISMVTFKNLMNMVLIYLFLEFVLWSTQLRPVIEMDTRWVPTSFISSMKLTTCKFHIHTKQISLMEPTYFSLLAMVGYFCGCGGVAGVDRKVYGSSLESFEKAMMGISQKFHWMLLIPWIVTFIQKWLQNVGGFLLVFNDNEFHDGHNKLLAVALLVAYFSMQLLLGSEVVYMALNGWYVMNNIDDQNTVWEQQKKYFDEDTLETIFGMETFTVD